MVTFERTKSKKVKNQVQGVTEAGSGDGWREATIELRRELRGRRRD